MTSTTNNTRITGGVSEMVSLISQVQQLSGKADWWGASVNILLCVTAIVGVLYFIATIRHASLNKQLRGAQEQLLAAKDSQLKLDLKNKDLEIGDAKKAAGDANERAGKLEKEAAEQRGIAAGLEKEAANLKAENLATATALAKEEETRLELEKAIAPRAIPFTSIQGKENISPLKKLAGTKVVVEYIPDFEARRAAGNVAWLLQEAGWKILGYEMSDNIPDGVEVTTRLPTAAGDITSMYLKRAEALAAFLRINNWEAIAHPRSINSDLPSDVIKIRVGFKPSKYFHEKVTGQHEATTKEMKEMMKKSDEQLLKTLELSVPPSGPPK